MDATDRFPWIHPDSLAAARWRELHEAGDLERLRRYEEMLAGPPALCTTGWRNRMDVTDRYPQVRADSRAAHNWRKLRAKGDGAGLRRLEERLEEAETASEVRSLTFCRCACGRLSYAESPAAVRPGELVARRRVDGEREVVRETEGVYRIHPDREVSP